MNSKCFPLSSNSLIILYTFNSSNFNKEVFEQSLTKVNKNTKKLLEDLLQSTKTISQVVTSIGVQKIGEGFFTDFVNKIKTLLNKLTNSVKRSLTDIDDLILISKKLLPKETIE